MYLLERDFSRRREGSLDIRDGGKSGEEEVRDG